MSQNKPGIYGGQAVIEGVMFAGKTAFVTAVRRKNNDIEFYEIPKKDKTWVRSLKKIPFVRGLVGIIDSSAKGSQFLNFSAEAYAEDEVGPATDNEVKKAKDKEGGTFSSFAVILSVAVVGILSFLVGKLIFTLVPVFVEDFIFGSSFDNQILHNLF